MAFILAFLHTRVTLCLIVWVPVSLMPSPCDLMVPFIPSNVLLLFAFLPQIFHYSLLPSLPIRSPLPLSSHTHMHMHVHTHIHKCTFKSRVCVRENLRYLTVFLDLVCLIACDLQYPSSSESHHLVFLSA